MGKSALILLLALALTTSLSAQSFVNVAPELGVNITTPFGDVFAVDFNGDDHNDLIYTSRYNAPSYYFEYAGDSYDLISIGLPQNDCDPWKVIPADFDHDGDLDLLLCAYHSSSSYLQNDNGQLVDRTAAKGLSTRTGGRDIAVADLNHDGWLDIIIGYYDMGWRVYQNDGGISFDEITDEVALPMVGNFHRFCEADVDLDGDVDLFMTTMHGEDFFFRNNGGVFEDYSEESHLGNAVGRGGCLWADFDNDKYPDLLTGGSGKHTLWHNNGDVTFTEMNVHGTTVNFNVYARSATYAVADIDMDGDLDIYAGQPDGGWEGLKPNQFFRCDSIVGLNAYFTDIAPALGMDILADTKPQFFDYDRDGDADLFLRTFGEPSRLYQNNMNGAPATRVRAEGPAGEQDCWLTRIEVYEHGTDNLVSCGESNYGGARRDGMNHVFTLDATASYDIRAYFANGDVMTPETYPDLSGVVPSQFDNLIVIRRGVGIFEATAVEDPIELPSEFTVSTYPNPFNAIATIVLSLPVAAELHVSVFDIQGRQVTTLADGVVQAGETRLQWNAENYSTGIYILRVSSSITSSNVKLLLLK